MKHPRESPLQHKTQGRGLHISAFPRGVVWLSKVEVFELLTLLLKHDEF